MKYSTQQLYGLNPIDLCQENYKDALIACKNGAKKRLYEVMQINYTERDESIVYAINKAIDWCEAKLGELE